MVYYNYPTSGIGGALVRLDNIASDNTEPAEADKFAAYGYLGAGTVVKVAYPAVTVSSNPLALTYWTSGGGYAGFDGLGRVIAQKWQIQATGGAVKDSFTYGYDANSSRLYRTNEVDHTFDELEDRVGWLYRRRRA